MRRNRSLLAVLAASWLIALSAGAAAQNADVTFLHVNDVYEIAPRNGEGGFAGLMTLLRRERARHPHSFTTVAGDFLSPSVLSGLTKGAQMIDLFNAIGVDLVSFGNHEFDFGGAVLKERIAASRFPWLGTNVRGADGKPFGGAVATTLRRVGDVRIGFLGIVTTETATVSSGAAGIRFADPIAAARSATETLRSEGADVVVALTHLSYQDDLALIDKVPGINLVLGGHDHVPISFYEKGVLLLKSGSDADYLGVVDLAIRTRHTAKGKVTTVRPSWRMIANVGIAPDPKIAALVAKYEDRLGAALGQPLATVETPLDSRPVTVRSGEAAIGDLVADALRGELGADLAIVNGGAIRGNVVRPAGTVLTRRDVLGEVPFGDLALVVELTGAELREALENGVSEVERHAGRFPQISGARFTYDPGAAPRHRIRSVTVAGRPLDAAATYRIATNDFLAEGGDGYAVFTRGRKLGDARFAKPVAALLTDYLLEKRVLAPRIDGRIIAAR